MSDGKQNASAPKRKVFPRRFLAWALVKTITQAAIAIASITFIAQSGFFVPFSYDASVWSVDAIRMIYLPQALFEVCDLLSELWMLEKQSSRVHLPWDSIAHHVVSGGYAFYIYFKAHELDQSFLGLAVAALSCQVIGPLYTLHRLRFRWRFLPLMILGVQSLYRCPLAVVSLLRAAQFYTVCPWPHFVICTVLAQLDYRWTIWAYNQHLRSRSASNKQEQSSGSVSEPLLSGNVAPSAASAVPTNPLTTPHLKAL